MDRHRPARLTEREALLEADILPLERALIGGIMFANDTRIPPLISDEFFADHHRVIWDAIMTIADRNEVPDLTTLQAELVLSGQLANAGGPAHLALCVEEGCIALHVMQYARQIREGARARAIRALGAELQSAGLTEAEIAERLDAMPGPLTSEIFDPHAAWGRIQAGWGEERIRLGIATMDRMTGGLGRGELLVVAGRTSHGKTAFTCDAALRLAKAGVPVEIITLEETQEAIVRRLVAAMAGIETRRLKSGALEPGDQRHASDAVHRLAELPLVVTGLESMRSLDEVNVLGVTAQSKATVVMLDHLQKVLTRDESRVYGLERVLNRLHAMAIKNHRVVWVNAQLNRETEIRKGPPELSDLRDSGAIEILARQVWMLYWPAKHHPERQAWEYEVYIRKNSDGGTGLVPLIFSAASGQFQEG
jgi:replicative DNA helicase